eukprot:COSAG02_NODE_13078_length_1448_cov_16.078862_1_plen_209_part_00
MAQLVRVLCSCTALAALASGVPCATDSDCPFGGEGWRCCGATKHAENCPASVFLLRRMLLSTPPELFVLEFGLGFSPAEQEARWSGATQRVHRGRGSLHAAWHHGQDNVPVHPGDLRNTTLRRAADRAQAVADDRRLDHRWMHVQWNASCGGRPWSPGHALPRERSQCLVGRALPGQVAEQCLPLGRHFFSVRSPRSRAGQRGTWHRT